MEEPGGFSFIAIIIIAILCIIICILSYIIISKSEMFQKRFRKKDASEEEENEYEEEIKNIILEGHEQGAIESQEAVMLSNVFEFGDKEAKDVMRFRQKIVGIDVDTPLSEAVQFMIEQNFSRFPLYEEDIDNIVGVLHLKDALRYYMKNRQKNLREIAREAFFVHETKDISSLFREMQSEKIHMAIVLDEYGQTEGIVAMEDILEIIVGNILDEYDIEEKEIVTLGKEGTYLAQGMIRLDKLEDILKIEFDEEVETLSGFLVNQHGRLPEDDDEITIEYKGYSFKTMDIHDRVIRQVKITRLPQEEDDKKDDEKREKRRSRREAFLTL